MSDPAFNKARLLELADAYCLDQLDDAQLSELNKLLRDHREACAAFGNFMQLHANLEERLLAEVDSASFAAGPPEATKVTLRPQLAVLRFFANPTPLSMSIAALVVGLLVTTMAFIAPPFYRAMAGADPETPSTDRLIVAEVTATRGAVWPNDKAAVARGIHLLAGRTLNLSAGLVEVTFRSGARVTLEGPARLTVGDRMSCNLQRGKLVALVPRHARGFTVQTGQSRIVDLGTEFAVETLQSGETEIHVITGRVEVQPTQAEGSAGPSQVSAGQALRIIKGNGGGTLKMIDYDAGRFARKTPQPTRQSLTIANQSFEAARLADGAISDPTPFGWKSNNKGDGSFNPGGEEGPYRTPALTDSSPTGGRLGTMHGPTFGFMYSNNTAGKFSQTLESSLAPETTYALALAVGRRDTNYATERKQEASTVTINLLAGNAVIATATGHPDKLSQPNNFVDLVARVQIGQTHPQLGDALSIEIVKGSDGDYLDIDNVRLQATRGE